MLYKLIGSLVGTLIKIDENTTTASRGKYARMVVAVNLNKPPIPKVEIKDKIQIIENENLPLICFQWGRVDHSVPTCMFKEVEKDMETI